MDTISKKIRDHWAGRGDLKAIDAQLRRSGRDPERLRSAEDLAAVDQLHAGQLEGTRLFFDWARVPEGAKVLDAGGGLGGAARFLAERLGCHVTSVELTDELHEAGIELTRRLGLEDQVDHVLADFLCWDGPQSAFDVAVAQHVDMHVSDKQVFFRRLRRALRGDGRLVIHDWLRGDNPPRHPLPWSDDGATTFLATKEQLEQHLGGAGLTLARIEPLEEQTIKWYEQVHRGIQKALGKPDVAREKTLRPLLAQAKNTFENIRENRLIPYFAEARAQEN